MAISFQRPMILGYGNAYIGLALFALSLLISIIVRLAGGAHLRIPKPYLRVFMISALFVFAYLGLSIPRQGLQSSLNNFAINMSMLLCAFVVCGLDGIKVNTAIKWLLRAVIVSTLITMTLSGLNADNLEQFKLFELTIKGRDFLPKIDVYFPFSTIPYRMTTADLTLPRATFWTIEPGVAVFVLLLWRYLEGSQSKVKAFFTNVVFVLSLAATASTSAPLVLACWFVIPLIFDGDPVIKFQNRTVRIKLMRIIVALIFASISVYLLVFSPYVGFLDKSTTHGESFDIRLGWFSGDEGILRIASLLISLAYYPFIRRIVGPKFNILFSGMFLVSVLNVLAFTPLFFISSFVVLNERQRRKIT